MKKRMLAILLAAIMTASLSACVQSDKRPALDNPTNSGTENNQVRDPQPDVTDPVQTITWSDVNDQVYIIKANTTLDPVEEGKTAIKANLMDLLDRKQVSSDNKKSIVEKDGVLYYVNNANLTDEDLTGAKFATCDEVMYVKVDVLNLRLYASSDNTLSPSQGSLKQGDAVKVVAKGEKWCKVEVINPETQEPENYFLFLEHLSTTNDGPIDYTQFFEECDPPVIMYVYNVADGQGVNLRTTPSVEDNLNVAGGVMKDSPVTVLSKGTGDYAGWYYVRVANATVPGMSQTYSEYYIKADFLTEEKPVLTLEELIAKYGFTAGEKTLYATGSINVRKTPGADEKPQDDVVAGLAKKQQVKVVASGLFDDQLWSIIELNLGTEQSPKIGYYFVRGSYEFLTTDPNGEILPTLDGLLAENTMFSVITEKTVYANTKTYGFDSIAKNPTVTDAKVTIEASTSYVAVAEGTRHGADWYIVRNTEGKFFFVFAEFFDDMQAAG